MGARIREQGAASPEDFHHSAKVLLVDDDSADLERYEAILAQRGFEVRCSDSYSEGAKVLEREPVDLVVVSEGGRAFEGRKVLERALELDRQKPVLIVTRNHDIRHYLEAMQMGAADYLEKPLSADQITRLVESVLRERVAAA